MAGGIERENGGRKLPCSAEDVLSEIGASNPFILGLFGALSFVWGLSAMPLMASAFMMGDVCRAENRTECNLTSGTITVEFGIHGQNAWLADLTTSSFLLGNVVGASFAGISDRHVSVLGRRPVLVTSLSLVGVMGCVSSLAPDIYTLSVVRFVQGVFYTACGLANWVLAYESIPPSLRAYSTLTFGVAWVLGYVAVAPLAYFAPYWRSLVIATSAPCIVFAVIYYL
ncbi:sugar transporter [Aphelenchoides avenae]|nr:sugar transporter [Aphelenchus avenae]